MKGTVGCCFALVQAFAAPILSQKRGLERVGPIEQTETAVSDAAALFTR
jgi:hypothetical protein